MRVETIANVLGALACALTDRIHEGLDHAERAAATLVHLSKYPGESIDALRGPLALSHPGCVRLVDRLEEERLVARTAGPDRRTRALRLTRAGRAAARAELRGRRAALRDALGALTPREQQTLGRLVGKILERIVADEDDALATCRLCDYEACPPSRCPVAIALGETGAQ